MAAKAKVVEITDEYSTEVERIDLHESVPYLANSKTLSKETMPGGKMFYSEGSFSIRIETKGKIVYMPVTNTKAIWMK